MSRIHIFLGVWAECSGVMDIVMMRHRLAFVKGWLVSREREKGVQKHIFLIIPFYTLQKTITYFITIGLKFQAKISAWNSGPEFCVENIVLWNTISAHRLIIPPYHLETSWFISKGTKSFHDHWNLEWPEVNFQLIYPFLEFSLQFTKYSFSL